MHLLAQPPGTACAPHGGEPRRYDRHWTPAHVDVVTGDLAAAVARATAAGATLERPIERRSWNAIAGLADPFGSGFDLVEEPGNVRPGALDLAIDVPDVARATLERPIETAAWGRLATFADPFGHGFCLVEPSALGYAALLDGEES